MKLRELIEKATHGPWEWNEGKMGEDGHVYVPQGSCLGGTMIALDDTYEGSDDDCEFLSYLARKAPAIAGLIEQMQREHEYHAPFECAGCAALAALKDE